MGDGFNQNVNETLVAVGMEYANRALDFEVYALTHPDLEVDYRFKIDGDSGLTAVDVTVDATTDNRMALVYNGQNGDGNAYPRPMFSARYIADDTVRLRRRRTGQPYPAWVQSINFPEIFSANDPPNFVDKSDGYSLLPGESLYLIFEVTVDDPLPTGLSQITNTASVTTNQYPLALSDDVTNIVVNPSSASALVEGRVWLDSDGNGAQDVGETGLSNVKVTLKDQFGTPIATTKTNITGGYIFTDVKPGNGYYVQVTAGLPAGLEQSAPIGRSDDRTDDFELTAGGSYTDADLGYKPDGNTATIGDLVWSDADANGARNAGEPGLAGITVELYLDDGDGIFEPGTGAGNDGVPVATAISGVNGSYLFTGVDVNGIKDYFVRVDTTQTALTDYTATTSDVLNFADLNAGDVVVLADFGFRNTSTAYSIKDRVWFNENGDGEDDGETGIAGVTVNLLDSSGNVIASTVTDADGYFTFNGVLGGGISYTVQIADTGGELNDYYGSTAGAQAGSRTIYLDNSNLDYTVEGTAEPSFGYGLKRSIGDTVFNDIDGSRSQDPGEPGIENVTINLYRDDGDGIFEPGAGAGQDGDPVATLTKDSSGKYIFSGLADGTYWVDIDNTQAALSLYTNLTTDDDEVAAGHQRRATISGGNNVLDIDYGYRASASSPISGTIWESTDGDGTIEDYEARLEGVTVELYLDNGTTSGEFDSNDTLLATTSTDSDGNYVFSGVPDANSYLVRITDELGVLSGYDTAYEKTEGTTGPFDGVELVSLSGSQVDDVHFGYAQPLVTLVVLSSFRAYEDGGRVVVEWQTALEIGTLGFYLYRKDAGTGEYRQINNTLLPGLLISRLGGTYRYVDESADPDGTHVYKLVEVESGGKKRTYGPYTVTVDGPGIEFSWEKSARKLGRKIKKFQSRKSANVRMYKRYTKKAHDVSMFKKERIRIGKLIHQRAWDLRRLRKGNMAKIAVAESGLYYLDAAEIAEVLDVTTQKARRWIRNNRLYVSNQGKSVAWLADEENVGIYFFGEGIESLYTSENIYWLKRGKGLKMRASAGVGPVPASGYETFTETVHLEEDRWDVTHLFDDPKSDYWIWNYVVPFDPYGNTATFTIRADGVADTPGTAVLTVHLLGDAENEANPAHYVTIRLNGGLIGDSLWEGRSPHEAVISFDQGLLLDGENTIEIVGLPTGAYFSAIAIDSFDLTYQRTYQAVDNTLLAAGDGNETITIGGFTDPDIRVFNVTNPRRPKLVTATTIDVVDGGYRVSLNPVAPEAKYLAITGDSAGTPASITADVSSKLKRRQNRADYLVITPAVLKDAAQSLADYRQGQGLKAMVVDLEDIMDEFNYGIYSPEAIRDFLSFAFHRWRKPPRYVVLAGEGTYDYKDLKGYGENLMPPLMVATPGGLFPSDNRYGDVDGDDGVPEMAIGRLPAVSSEEMQVLIDKIMVYENGLRYRDNHVFMLADDPDQGGNFPQDSDDVASLLPPEYTSDRIYLSENSITDARAMVLDGMNTKGPLLVNYIGHAGFDRLAEEGLLLTSDMGSLNNINALPVVTAMTCVMGQYAMPGVDSLSSALVLHDGGGAIAVYSPTGYSKNSLARMLNEAIFDSAFATGTKTLGEVILQASKIYSLNGEKQLLDVYNLLGDPALEIW